MNTTIKEDFIHYVWRFKQFDTQTLSTTKGEEIRLLQLGEYNTDAGPDFLNARLYIGGTLWAGNIEMHVYASDWNKHNHQHDTAYDNVILHVVYEEDEVIKRTLGNAIPCLELKNRIPSGLLGKYKKLMFNAHKIPCQHQFYTVSEFTKNLWLDRLLVERLEQKTTTILEALKKENNNWEAIFYRFIARSFGTSINAEAFEMLANSLPLLVLAKHKNQLFQLEALLFGQAGLLAKDFEDDYPKKLQKEYAFLSKKHSLTPLPSAIWKLLRLRPANFPTIRIAQFASLIHQSAHLWSKVLDIKDINDFENLFVLHASSYWDTHYVFDKASIKRQKKLGKNAIQLILINTIVPFLFLYGQYKQLDKHQDMAFAILEQLPKEKNSIIKDWQDLGVNINNAYQSQALLHLKKQYCNQKKCLQCAIGNSILKQ